jgi:hypothetical protein
LGVADVGWSRSPPSSSPLEAVAEAGGRRGLRRQGPNTISAGGGGGPHALGADDGDGGGGNN